MTEIKSTIVKSYEPEKLKVSKRILEYINKKNYIYQYIPESMCHLQSIKKMDYKNKKLKVSYLIDLTHELILKYYFKKENSFNLDSLILKSNYGKYYNYYIDYLLDNNILILVKNYSTKFKRSKMYSLNNDILGNKLNRYKNKDNILLKKNKESLMTLCDNYSKNDLINYDVKKKLIEDLYNVEIDMTRSLFFLDELKLSSTDKVDLYNRNSYSIEAIQQKEFFYHFDAYGRMHTNFTILKSFVRKNCLLIDGNNTFELDINNSQPLFLCKLIKNSELNVNVNMEEFKLFKTLTMNGNFYDYIKLNSHINDKKDIKNLVYKVFFGKNFRNSIEDVIFSSIFPTIHKFIKLYKREKQNYKHLAYDLQRMESNLIFNKIVNTIMLECPGAKIITVHDSIISSEDYRSDITRIFNDKIKEEFDF